MKVGAYQQAGPNESSLDADRRLFLIIAREFDLRIMIDLLINPAQCYQELVAHYALDECNGKMTWQQFLEFLPDWKTVESESKSATPGSLLSDFRQALFDWSVRWHLDADWCRDYAIGAMRLWGWSKAAQLYLCWDSFHLWVCIQARLKIIDQLSEDEQEFVRSVADDPTAFGINVSPKKSKRREGAVNPFTSVPQPKSNLLPITFFPSQTFNDYLKMASRHLEEHQSLSNLSERKRRKTIKRLLEGPGRNYHKQVEQHFRKLGWKQARQEPEHLKHLIWAVRYQVLSVECSQIAAGPPQVPTSSVSQTISRLLKQLGLRNRKRRGRPSKQSTKPSKH